jgi:hypothetical protein
MSNRNQNEAKVEASLAQCMAIWTEVFTGPTDPSVLYPTMLEQVRDERGIVFIIDWLRQHDRTGATR